MHPLCCLYCKQSAAWIVLFICFSFSGAPIATASPSVKAASGVMDLRGWDFDQQGSLPLSGQWRFYWNQFLPPSQVHFNGNPDSGVMVEVPSSWNRYAESAKPAGGDGYATYALRILLTNPPRELALYLRNILTAYRLYVNGELVRDVGQVAETAETMTPEYRHVIVDLPPDTTRLDMVCHVSNFHHRLGGIWAAPILGLKNQLYKEMTLSLAMNIFMIGSIFIMGLYHISLYILRKSYTPPVYLGLFCLLVTLRALVTNQVYLHSLIPQIPWQMLLKLEYLSFYLAVPVFMMFTSSLFPKELKPGIVRIFQVLGGLFSLVVLFFPARVFSHTVVGYEAVTLAGTFFLILVFVRAALNQREGIWAIVFGFSCLLVSIINDILHANSIIHTAYLFQVGMFIFVFSQAFVLSHRFSYAFGTIEKQTEDLIGMNRVLTREIQAREKLESSLVESHENFKNSRIALILGLAKLAEYRDTETGTHLERIREYTRLIATDLADLPRYQGYITADYIEDIYQSSILHDIGKIGIRDAILLKPARLTQEEFEIMKTHTTIGGDAITEVASKVKTRSFLTLAKDIAYYHHERWDGTGYPSGKSGQAIPLSARIVSLADVYDALISVRPYKKAYTHEAAVKIILKGRGSQFDPVIVDAFCRLGDKIKALGEALQDKS